MLKADFLSRRGKTCFIGFSPRGLIPSALCSFWSLVLQHQPSADKIASLKTVPDSLLDATSSSLVRLFYASDIHIHPPEAVWRWVRAQETFIRTPSVKATPGAWRVLHFFSLVANKSNTPVGLVFVLRARCFFFFSFFFGYSVILKIFWTSTWSVG